MKGKSMGQINDLFGQLMNILNEIQLESIPYAITL